MKPKLARLPSHYWWQNCYATFQEDPVGLQLLDQVGAHKALWASDYPHPESTLGYSAQTVRAIFAAISEEQAMAVAGGNAVALWNLG